MDTENNQLSLCGVIDNTPVMDHEVFGEHFYRMDLKVPRLSGAQDLLPVTVSERLMNSQVAPGVRIAVQGQLRSYNKVMGGAAAFDRVRPAPAAARRQREPQHDSPDRRHLQAPRVPHHALRAGNRRFDAGGEPGVREKRLYSLHRLGAHRPLRGPIERGG